MAWNRKAIAELVANKTVDVVFEEVANAGEREIGPADASKVANAGIDAILASITASEKLAEQATAEKMFSGLLPEEALAAKRRLARYASMARNRAVWIVAGLAGRSAGDCEQYRAASAARLDAGTLANELAGLIETVGLELVPCALVKGRIVKAKASPAAVMALASLENALVVAAQAANKKAA